MRFDAGGEIFGDITAGNPSTTGVCVVEAGSISSECNITLENGTLTRVKTFGTGSAGDLKCGIFVTNGDLELVQASRRITGWTGTNPQGINVLKGKIGTIKAGLDIDENSTSGCSADFDADGFLDFFDQDVFIACFECDQCPIWRTGDFDNNGSVDGADDDAFVAAFEDGCPP